MKKMILKTWYVTLIAMWGYFIFNPFLGVLAFTALYIDAKKEA